MNLKRISSGCAGYMHVFLRVSTLYNRCYLACKNALFETVNTFWKCELVQRYGIPGDECIFFGYVLKEVFFCVMFKRKNRNNFLVFFVGAAMRLNGCIVVGV